MRMADQKYVVVAKGAPMAPPPPAPAFFATKGAADAWIRYVLRTGPGHTYTRWKLSDRTTVTAEEGR